MAFGSVALSRRPLSGEFDPQARSAAFGRSEPVPPTRLGDGANICDRRSPGVAQSLTACSAAASRAGCPA